MHLPGPPATDGGVAYACESSDSRKGVVPATFKPTMFTDGGNGGNGGHPSGAGGAGGHG
jgi:hypothetical protein